jgi:hypothetical protein
MTFNVISELKGQWVPLCNAVTSGAQSGVLAGAVGGMVLGAMKVQSTLLQADEETKTAGCACLKMGFTFLTCVYAGAFVGGVSSAAYQVGKVIFSLDPKTSGCLALAAGSLGGLAAKRSISYLDL